MSIFLKNLKNVEVREAISDEEAITKKVGLFIDNACPEESAEKEEVKQILSSILIRMLNGITSRTKSGKKQDSSFSSQLLKSRRNAEKVQSLLGIEGNLTELSSSMMEILRNTRTYVNNLSSRGLNDPMY